MPDVICRCRRCQGLGPREPDWIQIKCRGCAGLGGELDSTFNYRPCDKCQGEGQVWAHQGSGVVARYPGGPFV